ncbi:hypothetical protein SG34_017580 [Thalassomonas viridans]|uniref:Uncharacterized protein n=1 Tax=Thalassomonas viridans TaxID=137584 RepID=A0AAF0C5D2_9GAMM|nr:hypothetical protein [Thalassomonas viridans]WDE03207.1 hypothetical protein SG34_017580 [Thalassomonas viridans]
MYTSAITCAQCKDTIELAPNTGPFESVTCPHCRHTAKFIDLQMKAQEEDQKFVDELTLASASSTD